MPWVLPRVAVLKPSLRLVDTETGEVTERALTDGGAQVMPRPWNDPLDTDLEHALGGVLIVASDHPVNSPDLVTIGAYIVFESSDIAYSVLARQLAEMDETENVGSMSVAGTKAWVNVSDGVQLAVMRLGYVLVIAGEVTTEPGMAEGLVDHLDGITQGLA